MRPVRVAVVCDPLEEGWPSMDLVGNMLCCNLEEHCGADVAVTQLRPRMRRRLTRLVWSSSPAAWNADRLINRFADCPRWIRANRSGYDVFHLVDHSYSQLIHYLPSNRTVVTCHDLDTFRCLLEPEREKRPLWFRRMAGRILSGFQRAGHVIAVSQTTREELLRYDVLPPERITVVPNGVDLSCTREPNPASDSAAAKLLGGTDSDPLLLSVGSTVARKRLDILLRVLAAVRNEFPQARLVRVGGLTAEQTRLAQDLGVANAITILQSLERETLAAVYRRAWLLLHTSEAEGFGLPVIEAMACGCPVVASDLSVLREVGGGCVAYCGVADVDAWQAAVRALLRERIQRPAAWEIRRQKGLAWAKRFSWAENARETAAVYAELLDLPSSTTSV